MSFLKSKSFRYIKIALMNLGIALILIGAMCKIEAWPYASELLIIGLSLEAGLFLMLGILGVRWND